MTPKRLRHVTERQLKNVLRTGLVFFQMNPGPDVKTLESLLHVSKDLTLTMRDGSEFKLLVIQTKDPRWQYEDELE